MKTCLVFGAAGWAGRSLVHVLTARGVATVAPRSREVDIADGSAVHAYVRNVAPDAIVAVAAAQPGEHVDLLDAVNRCGAAHVASAAAATGARLVHVSTDLVLDGRSPPYDDDARRAPLTDYGRSKAAGEAAVLVSGADAVCVRTSLLWDPAEMDRGTAHLAACLRAGAPTALFVDEIRCPLTRGDLARALVDLIGLPVRGTLNVAGREALSRHEFATLLLAHFRVPGRERLAAASAAEREAAGAPPRPRDLTLTSARAESLLRRPLSGVREVLAAAARPG